MGTSYPHRVWKVVRLSLLVLLGIIVLAFGALYLPFVQDYIARIATGKVSEATGWTVRIDRFRMHFPIEVQITGLCISDSADTLIYASDARLDISALSLLRGHLQADETRLTRAMYRLGTPDSAVYLKARIDTLSIGATSSDFALSHINVGPACIAGARVMLNIRDTITPPAPPSPQSQSAMRLIASQLTLRRIDFSMQMLPAIDTLHTYIGQASLSDFSLDMSARALHAALLSVGPADITCLTPSAEFLSTYKSPTLADTIPPDTTSSYPWTITADKIRITSPHTLYGVSGAPPASGLDMQRLRVDSIAIEVDSFYNRAATLRVPLRTLSARAPDARLSLSASGLFSIDSLAMHAAGFRLATDHSALSFDADYGLSDDAADAPLQFLASGFIGLPDISSAIPSLSPMLRGFAPDSRITLDADLSGSLSSLDIRSLAAAVPGVLSVKADGHVDNLTRFDNMAGALTLYGRLSDPRPVTTALPAAATSTVSIAPFTLSGDVDFSPSLISGTLDLTTSSGDLALDASWRKRARGYDLNLRTRSFPMQLFMPSLGISDITATVDLVGHGYDPALRSTSAQATVHLGSMLYNGQPLEDIYLDASIDTCHLTARLVTSNPDANADASLTTWFSPEGYHWTLDADINALNLQALRLSATTSEGSMSLATTGVYNPRTRAIDATALITGLHWTLDTIPIDIPSLDVTFSTADTLTRADITVGAFSASVVSPSSLDSIMAHITATTAVIARIVERKSLNVNELRHALPPLSITASSAVGDPVVSLARRISGISYRSASLTLSTDSLIDMAAKISDFKSGNIIIDDLTLTATQRGPFLQYDLQIDNRPGTLDEFASVNLRGFINENKFSARLSQHNIKGEQGFSLGLNSTLTDSTLTVRLAPYNPIIAYKQWTVNRDNFIAYEFRHRHIDANLRLSSDSSSLHLFTVHDADSTLSHQEDIVLRMSNIYLADWLSISPFSPPVKGTLGADMRFRWDSSAITGSGILTLDELYYGYERVGSFRLGLDLANDPRSGAVRADASLIVDGQKVITARGNLNDSTAVHPFLLDFSMIRFPLSTVNPFLGKNVAQLSGTLSGSMDITGTPAEPIFNGSLQFDSTAVRVAFTGTSYRFSPEPLTVDSNIVSFRDFYIAGLNDNNLLVNGTVNARHLSDISLNLQMQARDMQIVNSSRPRGANLYGKAFIDLDASVRGNMSLMLVKADLDILAGTNVTYQLTESQQALTAPKSTDDMIRFVSFADTSATALADTIQPTAFTLVLDAALNIADGSTINVDLSTDGKNRVQLNGSGAFSYSISPSNADGRLTGRYTINSGFVRYTPQLSTGGYSMAIMSEKNFSFTPGSYVAFNGPILNPSLSVRAVDRIRANVTHEGQDSRLVNFDIALSISGTLENMNVDFDLSTDDDITIENELRSMSPDQRANQAMNMLLYNQYTGPGTKASANLSGNPLYSFLASQLNTWAANNIRGIDISFGVDQYDTTTDGSHSTTTSYSYRVSKTLFNDRFKIVVGGNYSTDADADENFSQNLINDISFEYMLNRSGSMYVRLFRHVGYESILEGEIIQTGAGFVLKRKINSLRDIFRFRSPSR